MSRDGCGTRLQPLKHTGTAALSLRAAVLTAVPQVCFPSPENLLRLPCLLRSHPAHLWQTVLRILLLLGEAAATGIHDPGTGSFLRCRAYNRAMEGDATQI